MCYLLRYVRMHNSSVSTTLGKCLIYNQRQRKYTTYNFRATFPLAWQMCVLSWSLGPWPHLGIVQLIETVARNHFFLSGFSWLKFSFKLWGIRACDM